MESIDQGTIEHFKLHHAKSRSQKFLEPEGVSLFDTGKDSEVKITNTTAQFTTTPRNIRDSNILLGSNEKDQGSDSESDNRYTRASHDIESVDSLEQRRLNEFEYMQLQRENFFLQGGLLDDEGKRVTDINPKLIKRTWKATFTLNAFQNIEKSAQNFFYVLEWSHKNKALENKGPLGKRTIYTAGVILKGGAYKYLNAPMKFWENKEFKLPYHELEYYGFNIQIWSMNTYTFNQFYGQCSFTLKDVIESNPDMNLILTRTIQDRTYEVQRLKIFFQLQEIFDFDLNFESWSFIAFPCVRYADFPKYLVFKVPKGGKTGWKTFKTPAVHSEFWPNPLSYIYRGTLQELLNSYFTVTVMAKIPKPHFFRKDLPIGKTIMSLQSVTAYPLFRGLVKFLSLDQNIFNQGEIVGNIRCHSRSIDVPFVEDSCISKRIEQPLSLSTEVSLLDYSQQYLVVRIFKCENLPVVRVDSGTSDPFIKVKWDNIILVTRTRPQTLRPVFNQNLYFPIRLLNDKEVNSPLYRDV